MTITVLDNLLLSCSDSRETKRILAVKMALLGLPRKLICALINVSSSFVTKWKNIFNDKGADAIKLAYKGSRPYLTEWQQEEIVVWLKTKNSWQFNELVEHVRNMYNVTFKSKQSYYNLFKKAGIRWKKTQRTNPKKDPEKVEEKKKEIKETLIKLEEDIQKDNVSVFFVDESHLLWGDVLGYVWGKVMERVTIPITNTKYKQTYYGALNIKTKEVYIRPFSKGDGKNTLEFVKYLIDEHPERRIVLIWDGATYHKGKIMQEFCQEINKDLPDYQWKLTLILLAPHAPEQNPMEDVWLKSKNYLRQNFILCTSWAQVKKLFVEATSKLSFDFDKLNEYIGHLQLI